MLCVVDLPEMPLSEVLEGGPEPGPAQFVFMYDYACGVLASLRTRARHLSSLDRSIPTAVKSWAICGKWIVDKFHFKTHVGMFPDLSLACPTHVHLDYKL